MSNKLILVAYTPKHLTYDEVMDIKKAFNPTNEKDFITYIIPKSGIEDVEIKCLNPKLVSEDEFKKAQVVLEEVQKASDDALKDLKFEKELKRAEKKFTEEAEKLEKTKRLLEEELNKETEYEISKSPFYLTKVWLKLKERYTNIKWYITHG